MGAKERNGKIVLGIAFIVVIAAIIATTGNQIIYLFWALIPTGWLILFRRPQELGITRSNILQALVFGGIVGLGVGLAKYWLSPKLPWLTSGFLMYTSEYLRRVTVPTYIVMIVVGDAIREVFYRGYLQTRLARYLPPAAAVLVAAILLGLTDTIQGVYSIIDATTNGIISGYLFYRTKNLTASIAFMPIQFIVILLLTQASV